MGVLMLRYWLANDIEAADVGFSHNGGKLISSKVAGAWSLEIVDRASPSMTPVSPFSLTVTLITSMPWPYHSYRILHTFPA